MSFEIVTYTRQCFLNGRNNPVQTAGVQIGRFAIRHDTGAEHHPALPPAHEAPWRVDHIPSGLTLLALRSSAAAYGYADDVSRFSFSDVSAKDPMEAAKQMGAPLHQWTKFVQETDGSPGFVSYRAWLRLCGKLWTPAGVIEAEQRAAE